MTCPRCQIEFNSRHWGECPHCGALEGGAPDARSLNDGSSNPGTPPVEGVIKTSTILISTDDGGVFNSIEDVPEPLRDALVSATTGANSATIFIADRVGRSRIAAALRSLPLEPTPRIGPSPSFSQQARLRLRASAPVVIWAGFLVAGVSGALVWFAISHLK